MTLGSLTTGTVCNLIHAIGAIVRRILRDCQNVTEVAAAAEGIFWRLPLVNFILFLFYPALYPIVMKIKQDF